MTGKLPSERNHQDQQAVRFQNSMELLHHFCVSIPRYILLCYLVSTMGDVFIPAQPDVLYYGHRDDAIESVWLKRTY